MPRYAKARDYNERVIIDALVEAGCKVYQLDRPLDLLVSVPDWMHLALVQTMFRDVDADDVLAKSQHSWMLIEVKNPESTSRPTEKHVRVADIDEGGQYHAVREYCSRNQALMLLRTQAKFLTDNNAPMAVVSTPEEALEAVGITVADAG